MNGKTTRLYLILLSAITKKFILSLFLIFSILNITHACDNSEIESVTETDNGDGTYEYCFDLHIELGGLDVPFYGFVLQFNSSGSTPSIVPGTFPSMITDADLTSGTLVEDLIGLIGSDVNSEAQDSDWNIYDNLTNVLSYESFWTAASDDIYFSLCVTVDGCVEEILFDSSVNSGSNQCEFIESTGNDCSSPPCNANAGGLTVDFNGINQPILSSYDIPDGTTIGFEEDGSAILPPPGDVSYPAGIGLALFDCDPTSFPVLCDLDEPSTYSATSSCPCFLGIDLLPTDDSNIGGESSSIPGNSTLWVIQITLDYVDCSGTPCELDPDFDGDGCFDSGDLIQLNYLVDSPCDCNTPDCGGAHFCTSTSAEDDYNDIFSFEAGYSLPSPLPAINGVTYELCWEYTTSSTESEIGFVNAIGNSTGNSPSCDFDRVYHVYEAGCSTEVFSSGPSDFAIGFEYLVNPNTTYIFCVEITYTDSGCGQLEDNFVWLYDVNGDAGCGTCSIPCTEDGMGSVPTYDDRDFMSCYIPSCEIYGPTSFTNCFEASADDTGFLGFANQIQNDGFPGCIDITWELFESGDCSSVIPNPNPNVHGVGSGFNPEYDGLTSNGTYILCVTYDLPDFLCGFDGISDKICIDSYGTDCDASLTGTSDDGYACKDDGRDLETITNWVETTSSGNIFIGFVVFCDPPITPLTEAYYNSNALDAILETTDNIGDFINDSGLYQDPISGELCDNEIYLIPITIASINGMGDFIIDWDCYATEDVILVELGVPPSPSISADPMTICLGESTVLTATGGGTYLWSEGGQTSSTITVSPINTTTYTVTVTDDSGNCENTAEVTVTVETPTDPVFDDVGPYCVGSTIPNLPTTSNNGITGSWSPAIDNMNTTEYTFSPDEGQCSNEVMLTITIDDPAEPMTECWETATFNDVTCMWEVSGTQDPEPMTECWETATFNDVTCMWEVSGTEPDAPIFSIIDTYCVGDTPNVLPTTSINGVNGSWNPSVINTNNSSSLTYIFTPDDGCTVEFEIIIFVNDCGCIDPAFVDIDPVIDVCIDQVINLNAVLSGSASTVTWTSSGDGVFDNDVSPSPNYTPGLNDNNNGSVTLTVTTNDPDGLGPCSPATDVITITIYPKVDPFFNVLTSYCSGDAVDVLPNTSENGIMGTWSPGVIDNMTSGNYNFTPSIGECANEFVLNVMIDLPIDPVFSITDTYCSGDVVDALPNTSENGIIGTWSPGVIDNMASGSYTFTPSMGECGNEYILSISIIKLPDAGLDISLEYCTTENIILDLFNLLNGSPQLGGNWTSIGDIPNSGTFNDLTGTFSIEGQSSGMYIFNYNVVNSCGSSDAHVMVEIYEPLSSEIENSTVICNSSSGGENTILDFDLLITGGDMNGNWSGTLPSGSSGTLPIVDFDGTSPGNYIFSYTLPSNGVCAEVIYEITLTIEDCECPSVAISNPNDLCNDSGSIDLSTLENTIEEGSWSITNTPAGSNPAIIIGTIFDASGADAGTYEITFTLNNTPPPGCPSSSIETINVGQALNAGLDGQLQVCNDQMEIIDLIQYLSGADLGGSWIVSSGVPELGAFNDAAGTFDVYEHDSGVYIFEYLLEGTGACLDDNAFVTIEITSTPLAEVEENANICNSTDGGNTTIINFEELIISGLNNGIWNDDDGSGAIGIFPILDFEGVTPGIYTFSYFLAGIGGCSDQIYFVDILVEDCACPSVAIGNPPNICNDGSIVDLSNFEITDEMGSWSITAFPSGSNPAFLNGSIFDATNSDSGIYEVTFTLEQIPPLGCPQSASVNLTVYNSVEAGAGQTLQECNDQQDLIDLYNLLVGAEPGGTWSINSGIPDPGSFNPILGTFNPYEHTAGTFTFKYTLNGPGVCPDDEAIVTVIITSLPLAEVQENENVCNSTDNGGFTILDFTSLIISGDQDGVWTDLDDSGASGVFPLLDFTDVIPGQYQFSYFLPSIGGCNDQIYTVTILIEDCSCPSIAVGNPNDLCNNGGVFDLFDIQITPEEGTWSIVDFPIGGNDLVLSGSVFDATNAIPGDYTLIFTLTNPVVGCPNQSDEIILSVYDFQSAGIGSEIEVCNNFENLILLQDLLSGEASNGNWIVSTGSPESGTFDPIAGTFQTFNHNGGTYIFTYLINGSGVCPDDEESVTVNITSLPLVELQLISNICNVSVDGSLIDLNSLILSGPLSGEWTDIDGSGATGILPEIDFDGVTPGIYTFNYLVTGFGGCSDQNYSIEVFVEDCSCPSVALNSAPNKCNDNAVYDLTSLLVTTEPGSWSITSEPFGSTANIIGNNFIATGSIAGAYQLTYTLDNPVPDCPEGNSVTIQINQAVNAGNDFTLNICNSETNLIDLNTLLDGADVGGGWSVSSGTPDLGTFQASTGLFNVTNHKAGTYSFRYRLLGLGACGDDDAIITIIITESPSAILIDGEVCNESSSGSVIDFNDLITAGFANGTWTDIDGSGAQGNFNGLDFNGVMPGNYTFSYTIEGDGTCDDFMQSIEINVIECGCNNPATVIAGTDIEICEGELINLSGSIGGSATSAIWSSSGTGLFDNANSLITTYTPSLADNALGNLILTLTTDDPDGSGVCTEVSASINAIIIAKPPQPEVMDVTYCLGDSATPLIAIGSNLSWYDENGNNLGINELTPNTNIAETTQYYVSQSVNSCESELSVLTVLVNELPIVDAGMDQTFGCGQSTATLMGSSSMMGSDIILNWTGPGILSGGQTLTPEVNLSGTYTLNVENLLTGCSAESDAIINFNENQISASVLVENPLCADENYGSISINSISGGTEPYNYLLNGIQVSINDLESLEIGSYNLTIEDASGCIFESIQVISAPEDWNLNLTADKQTYIFGEEVNLNAITSLNEEDIADVLWTPVGDLDCIDCLDPIATPNQSTQFVVTIIDINGCQKTASIFVNIITDINIVFPNIFSPNDDGVNEFFFPNADPTQFDKVDEMLVFDRWGNLVFKNENFDINSPYEGWDGKFNGENVVQGVYIYVVKITTKSNEELLFQGDITVVR